MCKKVLSQFLGALEDPLGMTDKKILLIGFRATGKSTVGRLLSRTLGWPFLDMDEELQRRLGATIDEVVRNRGWRFFREQERALLSEINKMEGGMVVATGGGAVLHEDLFSALRQDSIVVWLRANPDTVKKRLLKDTKTKELRPALTDTGDPALEVNRVLSERAPLYERVSTMVVDVDILTPEEVSYKVLSHAR